MGSFLPVPVGRCSSGDTQCGEQRLLGSLHDAPEADEEQLQTQL